MPSVRCPGCNASMSMPASELGSTIECPDCGKRFTTSSPTDVTVAFEPRPLTRRKRDWGDEDEPTPPVRKRSGRNTLLLVGGILLVLFLVCGGIAAIGGFVAMRTIEENEARRQVAIQQQQRNLQQMQNIQRANQQQMNKRVPPPLDPNAQKVPAAPLQVGPGNAVVTHNDVLTPADPQFTGKPFKAYTVNLEPGKRYQIELASKQMDSFLRLYGPAGEPLLENDDFKGLDSGIGYTPDKAGPYTIHATVLGALRDNRPAPFTLTIRAE